MSSSSLFNLIQGYQENSTLRNAPLFAQAKKAVVLAKITAHALQEFADKRIANNFDPVVGESACQLRALKCALLLVCYEELQEEIGRVIKLSKEIFTSLEAELQKPGVKNSTERTLLELCGGKERNLVMSDNLRFLVESCLLTIAKKVESLSKGFFAYKDSLDQGSFRDFLLNEQKVSPCCIPSKTGLKQLTEKVQIDLADLSVTFLQNESKIADDLTQRMLKNSIETDKFGRKCAPCFYSIDVLLAKILAEDQRLLIEAELGSSTHNSVGKVQMLFEPNVAQTDFKEIALSREGSAIVFAGYAVDEQLTKDSKEEYKKTVNLHSLKEMLLANVAAHLQYPGEVTSELPEDSRFEVLKLKAQDEGFCKANPTFFVIDHIFCAMLKEVVSDG